MRKNKKKKFKREKKTRKIIKKKIPKIRLKVEISFVFWADFFVY